MAWSVIVWFAFQDFSLFCCHYCYKATTKLQYNYINVLSCVYILHARNGKKNRNCYLLPNVSGVPLFYIYNIECT